MTLVVGSVQKIHKRRPWGNSHLPPAKRRSLFRLASVIPLNEGVREPLKSIDRTPPPHLSWTIVALQISLNKWLPPRPLHSEGQLIPSQLRWVHIVVVHQHPEEPHRQTKHVALYPASHPVLRPLPLLSAVWETCLPPSLIQKPARSVQIHCECELQTRIRDRDSGNCNCRQCLHLA